MKASLCIQLTSDDPREQPTLRAHHMKRLGLYEHSCVELGQTLSQRRPLPSQPDYHPDSRAGVCVYYLLDSDHVYAVQEPLFRRRMDSYYCTVSRDGDIVRLSEQEARAWLQQRHNNARSA